MTQRILHLLRDVLDHELVDADGVSCGRVDDIELENTADGPAIKALLVGPGAWLPRLPSLAQWLTQMVVARRTVRVSWDEVEQVTEVVKLRSRAGALGLGRLDRKVATWLARIPRS